MVEDWIKKELSVSYQRDNGLLLVIRECGAHLNVGTERSCRTHAFV